MPRDSSGNFTLYSPGNPVVSGTTIASAWWNNTGSDLAAAMTDSLSRSGLGGMLTPFKLVDGSSSAPAFSFQSESNTGFYRQTSGEMDVVVGGTRLSRWTSVGFQESFDGGTTWKTPVYENLGSQSMGSTGQLDFPTAGNLTIAGVAVGPPVFTASSSSGTFSTTSTTYVQITNFSITFTANGHPVNVIFLPDGTGPGSFSAFNNTASALNYAGAIGISTDGGVTFVGEVEFGYQVPAFVGTNIVGNPWFYPCSAYSMWITPTAGSVTLKAYAKAIGSSGTPTVGVNKTVLCILQY